MRVLGDGRGIVIAISGASAVTSISDSFINWVMRSMFGSVPSSIRAVKLSIPTASRLIERTTLAPISGLKTLSSRWPWSPPIVTATWLPHDLGRDHRQHLGLGWIYLARHDRTAGSFSGSFSSPNPQRGPDPSRRMSLAILLSATAITLRTPDSSTIVS